MPPIVFDLLLTALICGLAYALMSEGLWGAALMFFNVLFSGIIAFNFYEPLAQLIASNVSFIAGFADMICMLLIFAVSVVVLRLTTETLGPTMVRFPAPVYHIGRIFFAFAGSLVTFAILVLALQCAPVHKKAGYAVDYKYKPPFGQGIDHLWLGFFQYTTGAIFANISPNNRPDPFKAYGNARVFDPRAEWLIQHQEARPYGTGKSWPTTRPMAGRRVPGGVPGGRGRGRARGSGRGRRRRSTG